MKQVLVVGIAGWHNSGKTTFIEALVHELVSRDMHVGVIKHTRQEVELDTEGTDSWRMGQAGAERVALVGPAGMALYEYGPEPDFDEVLTRFSPGLDIVLVEGYKSVPMPRIEVRRTASDEALPLDSERLAIVCSEPFKADVPVLSPDDIEGILALLKERGL